jgi:hypothetical protein
LCEIEAQPGIRCEVHGVFASICHPVLSI